MLPLLTRRCEDSFGSIKVKEFFKLKGESGRKCQLTGAYTTNERWDKGDFSSHLILKSRHINRSTLLTGLENRL
jgi:hypothetical protein